MSKTVILNTSQANYIIHKGYRKDWRAQTHEIKEESFKNIKLFIFVNKLVIFTIS